MKKLLSLVLALLLALSFAGCSGSTAMTEANVTATVDSAFDALKGFDTKKLEKYVDSKTLSVIITYANKHDQFADLGKALFKNLEYNIERIDLNAKTVTVSVRNKDLKDTASAFTKALVSKYSGLQMLGLLNNEGLAEHLPKKPDGQHCHCQDAVRPGKCDPDRYRRQKEPDAGL